MKTAIINAAVIRGNEILPDHGVLIKDGKIEKVCPMKQIDTTGYDQLIDAKGAYASAGWIELHTHGIGGYDFMDAESDKIAGALPDADGF